MQVANEKVVYIHYTLTNQEGETLDSSAGREPLGYLHGAGNIIPGLEKALEGKESGEKLNVSVAPDQAYGERDEALIQQVPRSAFEGVDSVEPGMQFQAQSPHGPMLVTVTKVESEEVTVDANHPLAGQTLTFDVEVTDVRDATEEELNHGHVHGAGGAHD
jgi:FKBP-type peptidyl-prolyl cis-trans isomerase SlyD